MNHKRQLGEFLGAVPLGFTVEGKMLQVLEAELATVRAIFLQRARGAILQEIADDLNARGVPTKRGGRWHPSTVRAILNNIDLYAGACQTKTAPLPRLGE